MKKNTNVMASPPPTVMARNEAISELCQLTDRHYCRGYMPAMFVIGFCLLFSLNTSAQSTDTIHGNATPKSHVGNRYKKPRKTALIVVDGEIYKKDLKTINPNTIAEISILKPEAGMALYGRKAANGVVLITTKK